MQMSRILASAAAAIFLSISVPSFAQSDEDRFTARQLGLEAQDALEKQDYKTAEEKFARADKLYHAPTLQLGLARAYAGQGKYVLAHETYTKLIREGVAPNAPPVFQRAIDDAKHEIETVSPKIGSVTITVTAAGGKEVPNPSVNLDGKSINVAALGVKRPVDPGDHVVSASAQGFKTAESKFTVSEGGTANANISLEKDAGTPTKDNGNGEETTGQKVDKILKFETPRGWHKPLTIGAFGLGAAGIGAGVVTGIMAMGKHSDLQKVCGSNTTCPASAQSNIDSYKTIGLVSTISFAVGGAGAIAGVILLVTMPKDEAPKAEEPQKVSIEPYFGFGSIGAVGRF